MTTLGDRPRCPDCGAQLRQGRQAGQRCDPCQRTGPRLVLPEAFYDQPVLADALVGLDFGTVLRAIRDTQHWSQETLAEFLGLGQGRISRLETGKRHLLDLRVVVAVANKLAIPAGKLGFTHGVTVGAGTATGREGSWMERRGFVEHVTALTVGLGVTGLDMDRLIALLPHAEPTSTRHVGAADVETIEQATTAFVRQDFAHGSGMAHDPAVAHLRATLPLLGATMAPEVRPRMYLATARLAMQAGWMSFDAKQHDAARRLWMIGLDIARAADHPQGSDLTVYLLYDIAIQAVHLQRPDEALSLIHLGHVVAAGSHPVSASTRGSLATIEAQAHAAHGDAVGCDHALGRAVEQFSTIDPATRPPWGASFDEATLAAMQGKAHYELALTSSDPRAVRRAVPLLRDAVEGFGPDYARARALYLPDLAGAHAIAGDTDTAVTTVHSPRAYDRLRVLNTALQPLHASVGVAELRERLIATAV